MRYGEATRRVRWLLRHDLGPLAPADVAHFVGIARETARTTLRRLLASGLVRHRGRARWSRR